MEVPEASTMSSTMAPWYPLAANISMAAVIKRSRVPVSVVERAMDGRILAEAPLDRRVGLSDRLKHVPGGVNHLEEPADPLAQAALRSEVQFGQRRAFAGIIEAQYGHSLVAAAAAG